MSEAKTYTGGCHCGKVRYEASFALDRVLECNCSICSKMGSLLAFVPADQFRLLSGQDALTDYQFNQHRIHHLFCSACGIRSFVAGTGPDGKEIRAINVRCLDDVDTGSLERVQFDGRSK